MSLIYFLFTGNERSSVKNGFYNGDLVYRGKQELKEDTTEDVINFAQRHRVYILHSVVGVRM